MIIVSIVGPTMADVQRQMSVARRDADLFEIRLDLLRDASLPRLLARARRPVIATCRPVWEGGAFRGGEPERIGMLKQASLLGAAYVDIELRAGRRIVGEFLRRREETPVIVSWHQLPGDSRGLARAVRELLATGADVVKLAYRAGDAGDLRHAIDFLAHARRLRRRAVAVAMGVHGEASRILYRKFGGWATYASAEAGAEAADGQVPAATLRGLYRADRLTRSTRVFGVVGFPVGQSRGVAIHNPLLRAAGVNGVYCRFPVREPGLFLRAVVPHLAGFSVTIPHKETMTKYLDRMDAASKGIGAVNTVVRRGRRLSGFNTDAPAALDAIEEAAYVHGKRMLILGAGGAARAIAWEARRRGAEVTVASRTAARARRLAHDLGVRHVSLRTARALPTDVLVNATPAGMTPRTGESPFRGRIRRGMIVFDAVYTPPRTRLLREAARSGAVTVPGTEMYVRQAAAQFRLYTGHTPALAVLRRHLRKSLRR